MGDNEIIIQVGNLRIQKFFSKETTSIIMQCGGYKRINYNYREIGYLTKCMIKFGCKTHAYEHITLNGINIEWVSKIIKN